MCLPPGFPTRQYATEVLNCADYKECKALNDIGQRIWLDENCDFHRKNNFVWQVQRQTYCGDLEMYLKITVQKMQNYKK